MPARSRSLRYRQVLLIFMAVLLAASTIADGLLVAQQRADLVDEAYTAARRELQLIEHWIAPLVAAGDTAALQRALARWVAANPALLRLTVTASDGRTLFSGGHPETTVRTLRLTHGMTRDGAAVARIELVRNISRIDRLVDQVRLQLLGASVVFIAILGGFLWFTVRRMALLPIEKAERELQMHRFRLERLVQERTAELSAANKNLLREVGERQQAEQELRRSTERLTVLREVDRAILSVRSLPDIAAAALSQMARIVPCHRAAVAVFDFSSATAQLLAVFAADTTRLYAGRRFPIDLGSLPAALRRGEPHTVADLTAREIPSPLEEILLAEGVRTYALQPMVYGSELLGVLLMASTAADTVCDDAAIEVGREVADLLALAIQQVRLNETVLRHAEQLEAQVERRTHALAEAQAELETLTRSISHDLRGHLWTVQGFGELLREKCGEALDAAARDYLDTIIGAADAMGSLIQDLVTLSHVGRSELHPGPVDLDRVIDEALTDLEGLLGERQAEVTVARPLGTAIGQTSLLAVVAENLISNGITYVAKAVRPHVWISSEQRGDERMLHFDDNGVGIAAEDRERVFRLFERLAAPEQLPGGTGVGLAIVHRAVTRMGGRVGVEARPEGGSRFWIALPTQPSNHPAGAL